MVSVTVRVPLHRSKPAQWVTVPRPDHSPCRADDDTGVRADGGVLDPFSSFPWPSMRRKPPTRTATSPARASRSQTLDRRDRPDIRPPPERGGAHPPSPERTDTAAPDPPWRSGAGGIQLSDRAAGPPR